MDRAITDTVPRQPGMGGGLEYVPLYAGIRVIQPNGTVQDHMGNSLRWVARRYQVNPGTLSAVLRGGLFNNTRLYTNTISGCKFFALDAEGNPTGGEDRWNSYIPFGENKAAQDRAQLYHDEHKTPCGYTVVKYVLHKGTREEETQFWEGTTAPDLAAAIIGDKVCITTKRRADFVRDIKRILSGCYLNDGRTRYDNSVRVPGHDCWVWLYGCGADKQPDNKPWDGGDVWGEDARLNQGPKKNTCKGEGFHAYRQHTELGTVEYKSFEHAKQASGFWDVTNSSFNAIINKTVTNKKTGFIPTTIGKWTYVKCTKGDVDDWKKIQSSLLRGVGR